MNPIRTSPLAALALAAALVGCDNSPAPPANPAPAHEPPGKPGETKPAEPKPEANKAADAKPAEAKKLDIAGAKLGDKELAAINKLDEADRKIALEQKLCPNSGAKLGSMGTPIKVTLKDQPVFLCCDSCEDDAKAKPDAMLAKLGR